MRPALAIRYVVAALLLVAGASTAVVEAGHASRARDGMLALAGTGVPVNAVAGSATTISQRANPIWVAHVHYDYGGTRDEWLVCGSKETCAAPGTAIRIWVDPEHPDKFVDDAGNIAYIDDDGGRDMLFVLACVATMIGGVLLTGAIRRHRKGPAPKPRIHTEPSRPKRQPVPRLRHKRR